MKKLFAILAAIALVGGFSATAMSADWAFYGNARMATFWENDDFDAVDPVSGDDEDDDLLWDFQGNSRIGATVKHDAVSGQFEYGTGVNLRRLFGIWDFGAGELKVGQDYTPITVFYSGQVWAEDNGLLGQGNAYGSRHGQIALKFGNFEIAAIETNQEDVARFGGETDTYLPKFEAAYKTAMDNFSFDLFGGFQTYEVDTPADDIDVTSWMVGLGGGVNFGAAYMKASASYYINPGDAGWAFGSFGRAPWGETATGAVANRAQLNVTGDDVDDFEGWMALLVLGTKVNDMVSFEAGASWTEGELDIDGAEDQELLGAYVQAVLTVGPGVYIIPEIGYYDYEEGDDNPSLLYAGAKWQINF